jgi:site-specific DNA recombinase
LEDPTLIQTEIDRRMEEAKKADPLRQREAHLHREQLRLQKNIDRLVTAYQEELVTLEQLRRRMPELRRQEHAAHSELQSLQMAAEDQSRYLRLADTLGDFRARLRATADKLNVAARQKILRLLVKEILVGTNTITIRHSIPLTHSAPGSDPTPGPPAEPSESTRAPSYLLRTWSNLATARQYRSRHH